MFHFRTFHSWLTAGDFGHFDTKKKVKIESVSPNRIIGPSVTIQGETRERQWWKSIARAAGPNDVAMRRFRMRVTATTHNDVIEHCIYVFSWIGKSLIFVFFFFCFYFRDILLTLTLFSHTAIHDEFILAFVHDIYILKVDTNSIGVQMRVWNIFGANICWE